MSTTYRTNYHRTAIDHWSNYEAVREFCQNMQDSDAEGIADISGDTVTFTNKNIVVSNKMLMTGLSDKRDDPTKRGTYGTGSIMALCVLTARGINVSIHNGDVLWNARFEYCDKFEEDVLVIDETPYYPSTDFVVTISGLSEEDISDIKQTSLVFQNREVIVSTKYGDIIESVDNMGEVYCGELFVQQLEGFKYSYNIKPEYLKLNQDRQSLSEFELQRVTSKLIMESGDQKLIQESIDSNKADTSYVEYGYGEIPTEVCDSYAESFLEQDEGSLVTDNYAEHQDNLTNKVGSVYISNPLQVKAIRESTLYQESIENIEPVQKLSPFEVVETVHEELKCILYKDVNAETAAKIEKMLDFILEKSEDWSGENVVNFEDGVPF